MSFFQKAIWPETHFFHTKFLKPRCIWFEVSYSVYQFIGGANDSNSNTEWSQRHSLYQTVIKKVSNNKLLVKSNLLKYKSHYTISIPKQFSRNDVQQGECLTWGLQILTWPSTQITLFGTTRQSAWLDAVTTPLTRSEWTLVYYNTSFGGSWATKNIVKITRKCSFRRATNVTFSKFRGWRCKKKETASAVLINELTRINSGPKILKSCFLHCSTCVCSWCNCRASCVDSKPKTKNSSKSSGKCRSTYM